jgi:beta-fructofuranosidase
MAFKLKDKWLWDFWFAQDGSDYHIFYLQSSNHWTYEWQRHFNVSVGHAVSKDLKNWTVLPDALAPSDSLEAFDNYTTGQAASLNMATSGTCFIRVPCGKNVPSFSVLV